MFVKGILFPAAPLGLRLLADIHPGLRCGLTATLALGCDLSAASRPFFHAALRQGMIFPKCRKGARGARGHKPQQNAPEAQENTARGKPGRQARAAPGRHPIKNTSSGRAAEKTATISSFTDALQISNHFPASIFSDVPAWWAFLTARSVSAGYQHHRQFVQTSNRPGALR